MSFVDIDFESFKIISDINDIRLFENFVSRMRIYCLDLIMFENDIQKSITNNNSCFANYQSKIIHNVVFFEDFFSAEMRVMFFLFHLISFLPRSIHKIVQNLSFHFLTAISFSCHTSCFSL